MAGLSWLMDGGMSYPRSIAKEKAIEEYVKVLVAVPSCGLRKAMHKLKHGHYENINLDFIPTPANMAAMARAEAKATVDDLNRLREKQSTLSDLAETKPAAPDEAARERVRRLRESFKRQHEEAKAVERGLAIHEPMTPERAAHWEKIAALPDAQTITAEQQAFRRKVEMDISHTELKRAAE